MAPPLVEERRAADGCGACFGCKPGQRASAPQIYPTRPTTAFERMKEFLRTKQIRGDLNVLARAAVWAGWSVSQLENLERDLRAKITQMGGNYPIVYDALPKEYSYSPVITCILEDPISHHSYIGLVINLRAKTDTFSLRPNFRPALIEHELRHIRQINFFVDSATRIGLPIIRGDRMGYTFDAHQYHVNKIAFLVQRMRDINQQDILPQLAGVIAYYANIKFQGDSEKAIAMISDQLAEVEAWAKATTSEKGVYDEFIKDLCRALEGEGEKEKILALASYQAIADQHGMRIENENFNQLREQALQNDKELYDTLYEVFTAQFKVAQRYLPA